MQNKKLAPITGISMLKSEEGDEDETGGPSLNSIPSQQSQLYLLVLHWGSYEKRILLVRSVIHILLDTGSFSAYKYLFLILRSPF